MTDHTTSSRRRFWIWGTAGALALAGIGLWAMAASAPTTAQPSTTTLAAVAETTEVVAASTIATTSVTRTDPTVTLPTRTVTVPSPGRAETVTTLAPAGTVAAEPHISEPTTIPITSTTARGTTFGPVTTVAPETTTTLAPETAVENLAPPAEESDHDHHDEGTPSGDNCHIHSHAVTPECHPEEFPTTTAPDPSASGDCPGNFHQWFMVRDECVLGEVRKEFLAFDAGSHQQRLESIRDGYLLEEVFAESQAAAELYFGKEAANDLSTWTSMYADVDNRSTRRVDLYGAQWVDHDRIDVRIRTVMADGSFAWAWNVVPFTYVDGQWKISYQGFCRFVEASIESVQEFGGTANPCPPDPRPQIVELEYIYAAYDPTDDPTRTEVNLTPGW